MFSIYWFYLPECGKSHIVDLTDTESRILIFLHVRGPHTPSGVADGLGIHPKTASRSLSRLEDLDLVRSRGHGVWSATIEGIRVSRELIEDRDDVRFSV